MPIMSIIMGMMVPMMLFISKTEPFKVGRA